MGNAVKQPKEDKTDTAALASITDIDTFGQKLKGLKWMHMNIQSY